MQESNQEKDRHTTVERPRLLVGIVQLYAETYAEQKREQCIEFAVNEKVLKSPDHAVKGRPGCGTGESPERKLRKIGQDYARKGKSA